MIIKSYGAPTIAAALKMVREEMGGDAIVLKTRACTEEEASRTGHRAEVTACIDQQAPKRWRAEKETAAKGIVCGATPEELDKKPAVWTAGGIESADPERIAQILNQILSSHLSPDVFSQVDARVKPYFLNLLNADVPVEIAHRISRETACSSSLSDGIERTAFTVLKDELAAVTAVNVKVRPGMKVAFVGTAGSGKTSVLTKAAAQLCTKFGQKIKLFSLDHMKAQAHGKIGAYAGLLDLPVEILEDVQGGQAEDSILLIDTPPICRERERQSALLEEIKGVGPNMLFLVFSACARSNDLIDLASAFESFAPSFLVATHLDETDRWGGILTMAEYLDVPVAFVTDSPGGIGQLKPPDPAAIARRLLKLEVSDYDS